MTEPAPGRRHRLRLLAFAALVALAVGFLAMESAYLEGKREALEEQQAELERAAADPGFTAATAEADELTRRESQLDREIAALEPLTQNRDVALLAALLSSLPSQGLIIVELTVESSVATLTAEANEAARAALDDALGRHPELELQAAETTPAVAEPASAQPLRLKRIVTWRK